MSAGVALAKAVEWDAEPLVKRTYGSDGMRLAQLAERLHSDVLVLGDRGLDSTDAVIGSVSDMAVHYATVPVLVVPNPLLAEEFAALAGGPVVVAYDGSPGADAAAEKARSLFPDREVVLSGVRDEDEPADQTWPDEVDVVSTSEPNWFGRPRDRATADALIDYTDRRDAAVLVVGSRGRSAVREVLLGSVAAAAVNRSHRPVLVVHS